MTFKFSCPHCGQHISASSVDVHTLGVCPTCQKSIEVPDPNQVTVPAGAAAPHPKTTSALALSIVGLILCLIPVVSFTLPNGACKELMTAHIKAGLGVLGLLCGAGLIFAHFAFSRSAQQRLARALVVVSFVIGYLSLVAVTTFFVGLVTGFIVLFKEYVEPPDFKVDFPSSDPAEKPAPKAPSPALVPFKQYVEPPDFKPDLPSSDPAEKKPTPKAPSPPP